MQEDLGTIPPSPKAAAGSLTPSAGWGKVDYVIGSCYAGRYRIDDFLGRGGMGSVYRVFDLVEKRDLALKILHPSIAEEEDGTDRFKREIDILSKIHHPVVPKVYGWGASDDELYFVAEFIDGQDLKSLVRSQGPWPPAEAAELVATVADALSFAHKMGIVHRDVKPNNIMIGKNKSVRLLDFGVARGMGQGLDTLTKTGMLVGTPDYMSPEQFETHRVDERSDIYSIGVVLFELLTGVIPFTGMTPVAVALKHKMEAPPPPRQVRPDVPAWLDKIVLKCLEKDPKNRYWTADELVGELRKMRVGGKPKMHWLPSGDAVVEDTAEATDWALVLSSSKEKTGWEVGMGLRYSEQLYKLEEVVPPDIKIPRWAYRFIYWPEQQVFRRLIDYEKDCAERKEKEKGKESLLSKFKKWFK